MTVFQMSTVHDEKPHLKIWPDPKCYKWNYRKDFLDCIMQKKNYGAHLHQYNKYIYYFNHQPVIWWGIIDSGMVLPTVSTFLNLLWPLNIEIKKWCTKRYMYLYILNKLYFVVTLSMVHSSLLEGLWIAKVL